MRSLRERVLPLVRHRSRWNVLYLRQLRVRDSQARADVRALWLQDHRARDRSGRRVLLLRALRARERRHRPRGPRLATQEGEERHAPPQERDAAQRVRRQGRSREESQAGDRDRALGSEKEGGQSPAPAPLALTLDTAYAGAFLLRAPRHFSFSRLVDG